MEQEKKELHILPPYNVPKGFRSKVVSIMLASAGVIIVLLLIGVGALLAGHVWNPTWNPFKQNSDKIIRDKIIKEIKK